VILIILWPALLNNILKGHSRFVFHFSAVTFPGRKFRLRHFAQFSALCLLLIRPHNLSISQQASEPPDDP